MRKLIRKYTPYTLRLNWQRSKRYWKDKKNGISPLLAQKVVHHPTFEPTLSLTQPIKPSHLYENKIHNLQLASHQIQQVIIKPKQILSFWHILQAPTTQNGYKEGRNIVNGILSASVGGGLCQMSGILYHLALLAGLDILERHHHSLDIYTEETRYSPLGADATVVYGYKDLRIQNNFNFPIYFDFDIQNTQITARLHSPQSILAQQLSFQRNYQKKQGFCYVQCVNQTGEIVGESVYGVNRM